MQVACRPARHGGPGTGVQLASVWVEVVGTDRVDSSWVAAGYAADVPVAARQVGTMTTCADMTQQPVDPCHATPTSEHEAMRAASDHARSNMRLMLTAGAAPVAPSVPCALTPGAAAHTAHAWLFSALHHQVSIKHDLLLLLRRWHSYVIGMQPAADSAATGSHCQRRCRQASRAQQSCTATSWRRTRALRQHWWCRHHTSGSPANRLWVLTVCR